MQLRALLHRHAAHAHSLRGPRGGGRAGYREAGQVVWHKSDGSGEPHEYQRDRAVGQHLDREQLLDRDQCRDHDHPPEAHDPEREQRCHESPAAADAPRPVLHAHAQRPPGSLAPLVEQEAERAPAAAQAGVFCRGQLVDRGREDHPGRHVRARAVPRERGYRERPQPHVQAVRGEAERGPRDQVAGDEG